MVLVQRTRPRLGDVIELSTPRGLAYAHYTHKHPMYGALLRVLSGFHASRPSSFEDIVVQSVQFMAFFPLGAACHREIVHIVANEQVPDDRADFPVFRSRIRSPRHDAPWWLWDGDREWMIGVLDSKTRAYPVREIWNDTLLIARITEDWHHELDA